MKFVLFIFFFSNSPQKFTTVDFESERACWAAAKELQKDFRIQKTFCMEK